MRRGNLMGYPTKAVLKEQRDTAYKVADILRKENLAFHNKAMAGGELARFQLKRHSSSGVPCDCRLCNSARIVLGINTISEQIDLDV